MKRSEVETMRKRNPLFVKLIICIIIISFGSTFSQEKTEQQRLDDLKNLNDQTALAEISKNDISFKVRMAAVKLLKDPTCIIDVAMNASDWFVRLEAVKKTHNQKSLAEIVKSEKEFVVCCWGLKKLNDQRLIADVIISGLNVQQDHSLIFERALSKISDPEILAEVAKKSNYKLACMRLKNQSFLEDVAQNAKSKYCREEAVKQLANQLLLAEIAKNDPDRNVREAAIERIDDQKILAWIARNDKEEFVRYAAIEKLNDQAVLSWIAQNGSSGRGVAISKINDRKILNKIYESAPKEWIRKLALIGLLDKNELLREAKSASDYSFRIACVKRISDQNSLLEIAKNVQEIRGDNDVRGVAVLKLTNPEILEELLKNEKEKYVGKCIVENPYFNNQSLIKEIALNHPHDWVREAAAKKIEKQADLVEILKKQKTGDLLQRHLFSRITDEDLLVDIALNAKSYFVCQMAEEYITHKKNLLKVFAFKRLCKRLCGEPELSEIARNAKNSYLRLNAAIYSADHSVLTELALNSPEERVRETAAKRLGKKLIKYISIKIHGFNTGFAIPGVKKNILVDNEFNPFQLIGTGDLFPLRSDHIIYGYLSTGADKKIYTRYWIRVLKYSVEKSRFMASAYVALNNETLAYANPSDCSRAERGARSISYIDKGKKVRLGDLLVAYDIEKKKLVICGLVDRIGLVAADFPIVQSGSEIAQPVEYFPFVPGTKNIHIKNDMSISLSGRNVRLKSGSVVNIDENGKIKFVHR